MAVAVAVVDVGKGILRGRLQFPRIRMPRGLPRGVARGLPRGVAQGLPRGVPPWGLQKIHVGVFIKKGHEIKCPETVNLDLLDLRRYLHQYLLFR